MEENRGEIEPATISDLLGLDTWNRPRTSEELQSFITSHHERLPDDTELA